MHRVRRSVRENRLESAVTEADYIPAIAETGRGWVIEVDGTVVAFAVGNEVTGNIWALFVHPGHERQGYGRRLHDVMVDWLFSRGLKCLWLTTQPDTRAQRFYESAGWVHTGFVHGEARFERRVPTASGTSRGEMENHPIALLIAKADKAINDEDFDTVVDLYTDDAMLVIEPGRHAIGKDQIRRAMEAIARHFDRSLDVRQAGMVILETADTALVLAKTLVSAKNLPQVERKATYVFRKEGDRWLCAIDNSYGHEVLSAGA